MCKGPGAYAARLACLVVAEGHPRLVPACELRTGLRMSLLLNYLARNSADPRPVVRRVLEGTDATTTVRNRSILTVKPDLAVQSGQAIGLMDSSHCDTGCGAS